MLRVLGYTNEIYIHGSIKKINQYYLNRKIKLGRNTQVNKDNIRLLKGQIILAPPSAIKDVWSRKINNKVIDSNEYSCSRKDEFILNVGKKKVFKIRIK